MFHSKINYYPSFKKFFNKKKTQIILVVCLSIFLRLFFLFQASEILNISPDYTNFYKPTALNILVGNHPYQDLLEPTPLGYSLFISAVYKIFGINDNYVRIAQVLFCSLNSLFIYLISYYLISKNVALISSIIWTIYPISVYTDVSLGTEAFTILLLSGFLYCHSRYLKDYFFRYIIYASLFVSLASSFKATLFYFAFYFLIVTIIFNRTKKTIMFSITILLFVLSSNYLLEKIFDLKKFSENYSHNFVTSRLLLSGSIPDYVYSHGNDRYNADDKVIDSLYYISKNSNQNIKELFLKQFFNNVVDEPFQYINLVFYKMWKSFTFTVSGKYDNLILLMQIPIIFLTIIGLMNTADNWFPFLSLFSIIFYFLSIHSLLISLLRYFTPALPCVIILCAMGLNHVYQNKSIF